MILTFHSKIISYHTQIETFVIYTLQVIMHCAKYEHPPLKKKKDEFALPALRTDSKIMLRDLYCKLHTIGNHCSKYEHPWSKSERAVLNGLNNNCAKYEHLR